jgi:molybdenum-dependent DNA-binding transcriptional regulator ModE
VRVVLKCSFFWGFHAMPHTRLSIRLDCANANRIGPGKIALLEAIEAKGSIVAAARHLGMCYRRGHGSWSKT